jgi:hypothetical protein
MRSLVLLFLLLFGVPEGLLAREAEKGVIDLRKVDFREGSVALDGEWEFYWERLITPEQFGYEPQQPDYFWFPKLWNEAKTTNGTQLSSQGFATYRLKLLLPKDLPPLSLAINHFYSDYDLYVDGKLLAENGVVGTTKETSQPQWLPRTMRILPQSDTVELIMHISNFHHSKGGAREPMYLGETDDISHRSLFNIAYDLLLSGCLIMSGLFFLGLYIFGQRENYIIAFGLFCLIFSYRFFGADNYALHILYPWLPWSLTLHLEYLALFLAPALFALYSYALFPKDSSLSILGGFAGISVLLSLLTLILPTAIFTLVVEPYLFLLVGIIAYVSYVYFAAARFKRDGARYALLSTMVVLLVFVYKIYVYLALMTENRLLTFVGFISFFSR